MLQVALCSVSFRLLSNSLEDFQGQGSHCAIGRRTVRKPKATHLDTSGVTSPLSKGLVCDGSAASQSCPCAAASVSGCEVRSPRPTVPVGLATGPASTPKRGLGSQPCHSTSESTSTKCTGARTMNCKATQQPDPIQPGQRLPRGLPAADLYEQPEIPDPANVAASWPVSQELWVSYSQLVWMYN